MISKIPCRIWYDKGSVLVLMLNENLTNWAFLCHSRGIGENCAKHLLDLCLSLGISVFQS